MAVVRYDIKVLVGPTATGAGEAASGVMIAAEARGDDSRGAKVCWGW